MIDVSLIEEILEDFPHFEYKLTPIGENMELNITNKVDEWDTRARRIKKTIREGEDLTVLRNVIKGKES